MTKRVSSRMGIIANRRSRRRRIAGRERDGRTAGPSVMSQTTFLSRERTGTAGAVPAALAFLGINEAVAASHDLVFAVLGQGGIHLHFAMPLSRDHFGGTARPFGDLGVVERRGNTIAIELAGLFDRRLPQFQAAVHAGRRASRAKQDVTRESFLVFGLQLSAERL